MSQRVPTEALRHEIVVSDYTGAGAKGPLFSAPRTLRASVQYTQRFTTDQYGRNVEVSARVIVRPESGPIPIESKVTHGGRLYRVIRAYPYPDDRRPTQWEVLLATWA